MKFTLNQGLSFRKHLKEGPFFVFIYFPLYTNSSMQVYETRENDMVRSRTDKHGSVLWWDSDVFEDGVTEGESFLGMALFRIWNYKTFNARAYKVRVKFL